MAKEPPPPFGSGTTTPDVPLPAEEIAIRLACAAALGLGVAVVYFLTQRKKRAESASFVATLVLLTILLAMVSMVIGSDIARAFSLVGALSIVRFRTVVEDTRDTAFVIFAVIAGMAAGAQNYLVPLIGVPLVGLGPVRPVFTRPEIPAVHGHAVFGQRTRLVGADDGRRPERLDRTEPAHQGPVGHHPLDDER